MTRLIVLRGSAPAAGSVGRSKRRRAPRPFDFNASARRERRNDGRVMSQQTEGSKAGRKASGGAIASLTGVGVLVIFIIQNTEKVQFQFLFLKFTWPMWLYTVVVAAFGALVWIGLGIMRRHRRRKERREERGA